MSIFWEDICNDGMDNLVVVTATGVHILQPDLEVAKERLLRVMDRVKEIRNLEIAIELENKQKEQFTTILHKYRLPSGTSLDQVAENRIAESPRLLPRNYSNNNFVQ